LLKLFLLLIEHAMTIQVRTERLTSQNTHPQACLAHNSS